MESFDTTTEKTTTLPETPTGEALSVNTPRPSPRHSIFGYTWKSRLVVFTTTLVVLGLALGIAFVASQVFDIAFKTCVFIALIVSFPVTQYTLSRLLIRNK